MTLALGLGFTLVVTEDGDMCSFGRNEFGQLGIGSTLPQNRPFFTSRHRAFNSKRVLMVAAGNKFGSCITDDGSVWTWGHNLHGQLGVHTYDRTILCNPQQIPPRELGHSRAVMLACGQDFTLVLTEAGHVWSSGSNGSGVLGHNDVAICQKKHTFQKIDPAYFGNIAVTMVAAGAAHCIASTHSNNMVWTWGSNDCGQLGNGTNNNMHVPSLIPNAVFGDTTVVSTHAGYDYSMVVTADGGLFACGNGENGELGLGLEISFSTFQRVGGHNSALFGPHGVHTVACGALHTIILAKDHTVWSCGNGSAPCLGTTDEQAPDSLYPTLIPGDYFQNRIVAIGAGGCHSLAITTKGRVYAWGQGRRFQQWPTGIGTSTTNPEWRPCLITLDPVTGIRAGRWHKMAKENFLGFVMGRHRRLGENSDFIDSPAEIMSAILEQIDLEPRRENGPGFRTMLGFD